jgi:glycosyltransferase involved in cell wall biosynthesis
MSCVTGVQTCALPIWPLPDAVEAFGQAAQIVDRRIPVRWLNYAWHRLEWPPVEWLTGRSYDVVHSPHPLLVPSSRAARLVTIHDLDFLTHPERTDAEIRRDYPDLVKRHAAAADGIIVSSDYAAGEVVRLLNVPRGRISVCPAGIPEWEAGGPIVPGNPRGRYILFLGTLDSRKNVPGLLAAYADLLARHPDAPPLVLAGRKTPAAEPWLESIARLPLAGHVEYRGYVPDSERQSLYAGARALVLPSFEEGFGLPALEAMSLGIPAIVSNRGALPEVADGAALLVEPDDTQAISRAMEQVLTDAATARRLGDAGLRRSRTFTWDMTARLTRAAYERAIDARQRRRQELTA